VAAAVMAAEEAVADPAYPSEPQRASAPLAGLLHPRLCTASPTETSDVRQPDAARTAIPCATLRSASFRGGCLGAYPDQQLGVPGAPSGSTRNPGRASRSYDAGVTTPLLRYTVGNEHDPGDPWGRSELVIHADGSARLEHRFSRVPGAGAWTGQVDGAALNALRVALDRAGFPAAPPPVPPVAEATPRRLAVELDGAAYHVTVGRAAASLPGYAEAFDLLDGIIRQLSGDVVDYPTSQPPIVRDIAPTSLR
jgi:hypothetical protein